MLKFSLNNLKTWHYLLLICSLIYAVYFNSLGTGFIWDDVGFYKQNFFIRNPGNIPELFTRDWHSYTRELRYRPVPIISYFLYYFAAKTNASVVKAANLSLHCLSCMLLFLLAYKLLRDRAAALIAAILFAVHPLNSEINNIVTFNDDVFALIFIICGILTHVSASLRERYRLPLENIFYILAFFTKEAAVVFPVSLLCYDLFVLKKEKYLRYLAHFSVTVLLLLVKFKYLAHPLEKLTPDWPGGLYLNISIFIETVLSCLKLIFYPVNLSFFHQVGGYLSAGEVLLFAIFLILLFWGMKYLFKNERTLFFILLFTVLTFIPSFYSIYEKKVINERFMYLPMAGICLLAASGIRKFPLKAAASLSILLAVYFSAFTITRNNELKDPVRLELKEISLKPDNWMAWGTLGELYRENKEYRKSLICMKIALKYMPNSYSLLLGIAGVYIELGRYGEAEYILKHLSASIPGAYETYYFLGDLYKLQKKYLLSEEMYKRSIALFRTAGENYRELGNLYEIQGKTAEAAEAYKLMLQLDPGDKVLKRKIENLSLTPPSKR